MSDSNKTSPDGTNDSYALGRSEREYARLARQAELLRPTTQRLFVEAGIGPGMRVLDVGSGAGDVSFLLAKLVGPSGEVLGVDLDAEAVRHSRERAAAAGLGNVRFQQADLSQTAPAGPFDAIVGRLALMYLADPGAGLGRLVRNLRPGGIVAFMEPFFQIPPGPESMLKMAATMFVETLRRTGAHVDLGPRLHMVYRAAGLPVPNMRFEVIMDGHEDSPLYQYVADTVRNMLPRAIELGVPGAAQIDVAAIPGRLRAEMQMVGYAMMTTPLVSAWCAMTR